jgi:dipeptidyl aminopeptidase/acylaminoacyl peptidase
MIEDAPELAAELVVDGAVPSQPAVSPDGCWVAYVVAPVGRGGERCLYAIWLAAADGSSPPWKLTAGTAADSDPRWAPDSASVFFLSDRTGSRQLHRVRVGGGEAEVLTDWRGEIYDAWPLADARLVAVVATNSLGYNVPDDKRRRLLTEQRVEAWCEKGTAHRFEYVPGEPIPTLVEIAAKALRLASGDAREYWPQQLSQLKAEDWERVVAQLPRMSDPARSFALYVLEVNWRRVLDACM